jgi:hypothetical protein
MKYGPVRFPLMTWEQLKEVQSEPLLANDIDVHELLKVNSEIRGQC